MRLLSVINERLQKLGAVPILVLAAALDANVGAVDYLSGYEISMSLFYLGPVALAAWYGGRRPAIAIAALSCACWYAADYGAGNQYSHPAIPVWNALVRLGFFLIVGLLLTSLRDHLRIERQLARTDALTGLHTRRAFEDRLEHDLALARRHRSPVTVAYVDLDNFKAVNDTRGHAEGDRVLRSAGEVLKNAVRQTDTAARLGGDEFALVLPDTDARGAQEFIAGLARDLLAAFRAGPWNVNCSVGVVTFLEPAESAEKAVAAADALMYEVKRKGKGAVQYSVVGEPAEPPPARNLKTGSA